MQAALLNKITAKAESQKVREADISVKKDVVVSSKTAEPVLKDEISEPDDVTVETTGRSVDDLKARLETIKNFI